VKVGRVDCGTLYGLSHSPDGGITFQMLTPPEPELIRARKVNGRWVEAKINLTKEQILAVIRADRESR
jgi:hypothetical protein